MQVKKLSKIKKGGTVWKIGNDMTVRWFVAYRASRTWNGIPILEGVSRKWEERWLKERTVHPAVKPGFGYADEGGIRTLTTGSLPDLCSKIEIRDWFKRIQGCILLFLFSWTTETKKVLCSCASHSFLFIQWNEHAWRALIKSSPGTMTLSTCLLFFNRFKHFNNVCSVLFKSERSSWALRAFTYEFQKEG